MVRARVDVVCLRLLMEEYIVELETRLDGELVDALDDAIGQKMEENKQEKIRWAFDQPNTTHFTPETCPSVPRLDEILY